MPRHCPLLPLVLILAAVPFAWAAEKTDPKAVEADIHKVIASVEDCFNRGDAKALADCWTPNGEFTGPHGDRLDGRANIEAAFRDFLVAHKSTKLRLSVVSWRLVDDSVALVDMMPVMTPAPEGLESEPASQVVLVKQDGRWLIGSMHETMTGELSQYARLRSLQWMVGDWEGEGTGESAVSVHSTCDWTKSGNYLIRKFTTELGKGVVSAGTEVIGWDPRMHRIRSWTFDTDGGFGESTWTKDGNRWIIKHVGTLPDGGDVSGMHVVTVVDANTLAVQSKDRTINGAKHPDLPEVKLKRAPVQEAAKTTPATPPRQVLP